MDKGFKLEDIKSGYLLKVKNTVTGKIFNMTVAEARLFGENENSPVLACCSPRKEWWPLSSFGPDLEADNGRFRIVEVWGYTGVPLVLDNSTCERNLIWKRPEVKRMTVAQIGKALGYAVEVIKDEETED